MDVSAGRPDFRGNGPYPARGTYQQRLEIVKKFNKELKEQSTIKNFCHIEFFNLIAQQKNYHVDPIHLSSPPLVSLVLEELKRHGAYE